jgi:hypothetical protein
MNKKQMTKKDINKVLRYIFIPLILAFVGLFLYLHCKDRYVRENGDIAEATVYAQKYGYNERGGLICVSWAYFYVNDSTKQIFGIISKKVPINTKFKVVYLPKNPKEALALNPKEFDKYPSR